MATIAELLDLAKKERGIPTDTALGLRVDRSRSIVSQWRKGTKFPEDDKVLELAKLARQDPGPWLLHVQALRSSGAVAHEWQRLAQRVGVAAALAVVLYGNPLFSGVSFAASLPMHIMFGAAATLTAAAAWWVLHMENRRG